MKCKGSRRAEQLQVELEAGDETMRREEGKRKERKEVIVP